MVETRAAPRFRLMKAAKIDYGGVKTPYMIRDLSITGAALEISELSGKTPATFNLILPDGGLKLPCHVVWRSEFKIGVSYIDPPGARRRHCQGIGGKSRTSVMACDRFADSRPVFG